MDQQKLKLEIIQRITACQDQELLQTIYQLLRQLDKGPSDKENFSTSPQLLSALLGETAANNSNSPQDKEEAKQEDGQPSLDEEMKAGQGSPPEVTATEQL